MGRTYAAVRSAHGERRIAVLRRRRDYLQSRLAAGDGSENHDRKEASALTWVVAKVEELRTRLDQIVSLVEADAPYIAGAVRSIAEETDRIP